MALSKILEALKFTKDDFEGEHIFKYNSNLGIVNFVELKGTDEDIGKNFYNSHREIWNENISEVFITTINDEEVLICDSKTKPDKLCPIETAKIDSFKYGENTDKENYYLELLKKESIDSGYFWEKIYGFIRQRIKDKKRKPIDVDLLKNLTDTKEKILNYLKRFDNKDEIAQKLIDRCLFIRFLEDRINRNDLKDLLNKRDVNGLLSLFDKYNDCLNGDLFESGDIPSDIEVNILDDLNKIFGENYRYTGGQFTLVPYQFDKIPIFLISHIYEQFLNPGRRRGEGIVFTPENVAEYTIEKVFESESIKNKSKEGNITVLDPSCGSGIFLVKFFERLVKERESELDKGKSLDIYQKSDLLTNSIHGIDTDPNALRIAAFSLYLKIFDGINPEILKKVFEKCEEKKEHFMFPGLKDRNLFCRNSLFDNEIFKDKKFDLILGNPPWSYKKFSEDEKRKIRKKWPDVSDYQSSQCFLFKIENWMTEDGLVGMVVNLSNFINEKAVKFRKSFLEKYSLNIFLNLINIKKITFGNGSEPSCVLIFNKNQGANKNEIEFITPDMTQFSNLTNVIVINEEGITKVSQYEFKKLDADNFWHLCVFGMNKYRELIERIEKESTPLEKHSEDCQSCARLYASDAKQCAKDKRQLYESYRKKDNNYFPMRRSLEGVKPYMWLGPEKYLKYCPHLDRGRTIDVFKGYKLVVTRYWPVRAFSLSDTIILAENFNIIKFKPDYLPLFEAILNSKLAYFYLAAKYLQRPEGNYSKIDLEHLKKFPIPNLKDENIIREIINNVLNIKQEGDIEKYQDQIDNLIFKLYDLDYYERQQIKDYYKIQKRKRKNLVNTEDIKEYANEFINAFSFFIQEGNSLKADCFICNFLGAAVKFSLSANEEKVKHAHPISVFPIQSRLSANEEKVKSISSDLKKLLRIIQYEKINDINLKKNILKEYEIRIHDDKALYLYKSNMLKDWTMTKALDDVKKEVGIIYKNLPDKKI